MKIISSELYVKDNKVYHEGNKPKPKDIGAAPETHTHNYASATTPGGSAEHAIKATEDSLGQRIDTYIKGLSVSGRTITYTRGDGTTGTITTQDNNTDTKVTNTLNTTAKAYITGTTDSATNTGTQVFDTNVYLDTTAGMLTATTFKGALQGNATTATSATSASHAAKLTTPRSINGTNFDGTAAITTSHWGTARTLTIGNTGKSVNGSGNVSWSIGEIGAAPTVHNHTSLTGITNLSFAAEGTDSASITTTVEGVNTYFDFNLSDDPGHDDMWRWRFRPNGGNLFNAMTLDAISTTEAKLTVTGEVQATRLKGTLTGDVKGNVTGTVSGNAGSATKLATARTINGTSFDGTANITTANWGTARTLTVGSASKSVNGSANVTWSLDEIGARTRIKKVIDLSNTTTYSVDKWYPCLAAIPDGGMHDIEVAVQLNSGVKPSWSTHQSGFTCNLHVKAIAGGWGTTTANSIVLNHSYGFASANPCSYSQLTNSSNAVLWLRGGGKYFVFTDWNASWSVKTASTEISSQTVAPATSCPSIALTRSTMIADLSGNATTATKLQTARTINGTNFDGTSNITTANWGTARNIYIADADGTNTGAAVSVNGSGNATLKLPSTIKASLTGNASTATTLQTARTINGTSFNGSANITTANWGTARNIQIGNTAKSVNGSANVSWSLSEIGAAASNHTHSYLPLSGGTLTGSIKFSGGGYNNHAIRMEAGDNNGAFIGIGAGGLTVIGSGESTNAVRTALTNGADETMIVASDQTIRFLTGVQNGYDSAKEVSINTSGVINAPQGMIGNASTATKLQTVRSINGTNFDGSANITTANWGTARNIQIGNTAKSVNGSGNVAWSLSEIGAVANANGTANNITLGKYATFADYDDSSILKKSYLRSGVWTTEFTDMKISGNLVYHAGRKPTASEIGAAASNHTHNYLPLSGGTLTGSLKISGNNKDLVMGAGTGDVYINNTASGKYIQMKDDGLLSYSGNKIYHAGDKPTASEVGALATSGGTMTGNVSLNNNVNIVGKTGSNIADSTGATVAAGATGTLISYNSSHNFHLGAIMTDKKLTVGNTYLNAAHNMHLRNVTSDGNIYLQIGGSTRMTVNSTATTVSKLVSNGGITTGGSIVSDTALTDNLGSSSIPFNVGYVKQITLAGEASKPYGYMSAYTVGTTSTNGEARLVLGNNIASGTASNASGSLYLYGTGAGYTRIRPSNNTENNYTQYLPTGNGSIPLLDKAGTNYWGMVTPDGSASNWIRTTSSGIIPFDQSATSALGTSSWPFKCAYINEIFESGTSLKNKYLTKSGGTLTGNLTVQGQTTLGATVLNNNTSLYGYNTSGTRINICGIDTSNNIYLGWNNETYINVNNTMRTYRDLHVLNGAAMRVTGQTVLARTESYRQIAVVSTAGDGNGQGDGQTHLGYFDNGYHHYFRGSGAMHVDMLGGLKIGGKRLSIGSSAHSNPATGDVWIQV